MVVWCDRMSNTFINAIYACLDTGLNEEKVGILEESRTELFHSLTVISTCKFNNNQAVFLRVYIALSLPLYIC